ncbi:MAG: putative bifunctional diguanylate cyclase/phosphodiesterase [Rhodospirillales bacterium]
MSTASSKTSSALVSAAIGSIAILIVLWLGLQRLVANPIIRLRDHVLLVGETGDLYRESGLAGRSDEVGELAGAFESMQSRVAKMAHYDGLTGLPNRTLFRDRAEQAMRRARRNGTKAAFLFVDLDRFKSINDTYGHDYGDRFLAAVASRLIRQLKEGDTVARFGGDEFVFVMDGIPGQDAVVDICDRLRAAFIEPVNIDDDRLFANMSIGVSIYPDDGETVTDLTRKADSAMYQAKEDGRNTYRFFNPEIEEKVQERLRADSSLRMAVEAGDLLLHYQPIMDLESDRIIAVEALARWPDAEKGLVRAEVFLTRVQDGEALGRLDAWAVAESAKAARALQDRGLHDVPVAVNVGAASFNSGALTALVENAARDAGVDAGRLRIEVTEHALLLDQEHTHGILRRLKKMGCRIILDDFGTGFSALGYLRQFELDGLKVDKRFIRGADRDENHGAIVEAVLALGRALKLDVIAEGVETPGEQDFLIAKGCHFAQGYHFSDALALDDLIALLETRRQAGKA